MYRFGNSIEDLSIAKIEGGIRAIKNGSKTPKEANVNYFLDKLAPLNKEMHDELLQKYIGAVNTRNEDI